MWPPRALAAALFGLVLACAGPAPPPADVSAASETEPAPPPPVDQAESERSVLRPLPLVAGRESRETIADEEHVYSVEVAEGGFASLVVEQDGVDVALVLDDDAGVHLTEVDSPNGDRGPEPLLLTADEGRRQRLTVRTSGSGQYVLRVLESRRASADDRRRVAAERLFARAEEARQERSPEACRRAVALHREALAAFRRLGELPREGDTLDRLGRLHRRCLGVGAEALAVYEEAIEIFRRLGERRKEAAALNGLGVLRRERGETELAVGLYREALAIQREVGTEEAQVVALRNLGRAENALGRLEKALTVYEEALDLWRKLDVPVQVGSTLSIMGELYIELGRPEEARAFLEKAAVIFAGKDAPRLGAINLIRLAGAERLLGRPEKALDHGLEALKLLRGLDDRRQEIAAQNAIGLSYANLGRHAEALDAFTEAATLARELGYRLGEAFALTHLGQAQHRLGKDADAAASFAEALRLFRAAAHPRGEHEALGALARFERDRGNLEAARRALERALERVELLRESALAPAMRIAYFASASVQEHFTTYIDVLMALHRADSAAGFERLAFEASERARARNLLDLLAEASVDLRRHVPPELLAREAELGERLSAAEQRRRFIEEQEGSPAKLAAAEEELAALREEDERLQAEIRRRSPPAPAWEPSSLAEIQRHLDADTVLLELSLGEERSWAWAVTSSSGEVALLPPRRQVEDLARRTWNLASESHKTLAQGRSKMLFAELGRMLLEPLAGHLDRRRWLVVADGALSYIPFAALPLPGTSTALVEDHEVVSLPSASLLIGLLRQGGGPSPERVLAVLADPVFDADDPRVAGVRSEEPRETLRAGLKRQLAGLELTRLPFTQIEAEKVLALVPDETARSGYLGFAAHRDLVMSGALEGYRILHFATHGFADAEHPELSGIALSRVDESGAPRDDGFLRVHDIGRLRLEAELVVLSACQTALGKVVRGEGVIGLARSFMAAGSRQVLVSLWQVEDRATADLMELFYRRLLSGSPPSEALRYAQLELRGRPGYGAPYYWAGFLLFGADHPDMADHPDVNVRATP